MELKSNEKSEARWLKSLITSKYTHIYNLYLLSKETNLSNANFNQWRKNFYQNIQFPLQTRGLMLKK